MRWWAFLVVGAFAVAGCSSGSGGSGGAAGEAGSGGAAGESGAGGEAGEGGAGGGLCPGGCADAEYCAGNTCDAPGTCEEKPTMCLDIFDLVCGCDGNTYGNGCEAAAAGVRVDVEGRCPCASNDDCLGFQYCAGAVGTCGEAGDCQMRPEACPLVFDPVCGCDGVTYDNDCNAAQAGTRVSADGPC